MMNRVILLGRLGSDPEFKATASSEMCRFTLATSEKIFKDGDVEERTEWHRIVVWGKQAHACSKYLKKGAQVAVEGRLQTRSWQDKHGEKKFSTEVVAEDVRFLDLNNGNAGRGGGKGKKKRGLPL